MPKIRQACAALMIALLAMTAYGPLPAAEALCAGFLPANNLKIPVGQVHALGLDQTTFDTVLDRVQAVYGPIVAAHGGYLLIRRYWTDPTVNASAQRWGDDWIINMYGGLARYKGLTYEGFALVACHELGHHFGGYPRTPGSAWQSNEGEADYYATLKCLRRVLGANAASVDPFARKRCAKSFPDPDDEARCEAGAMAGLNTAALLAALGGAPAPRLGKADLDPARVPRTNNFHPAAQCRLDTYFEGALCSRPVPEELSATDPAPGACTESGGDAAGLRPRCWYKPPVAAVPALAWRLSPAKVAALQGRLGAWQEALAGGQGFE